MHQKNLIKNDDKDDKDKKQQQNNNIDTKPPNIFNYLKSLSQETNDLMDEIEEVSNDIDICKLVFIGSNKETFNFNTFKMPLNFISAIYNGEISLKEAEFKQRDLETKIGDLYGYELKNKQGKEETNGVLMQANDLLEYRDKIINAFNNCIFLSEHLKESEEVANNYVLKVVNEYIEKIKSMEEKLILVCLKNFLNYHHHLIMQKCLLILKCR